DLVRDRAVVVLGDIRVVGRVGVLVAEVGEDLEGVHHAAERRVELVRDAGGEASERRQPVGARQALLARLELLVCRAELRERLGELEVGLAELARALAYFLFESRVQRRELRERRRRA